MNVPSLIYNISATSIQFFCFIVTVELIQQDEAMGCFISVLNSFIKSSYPRIDPTDFRIGSNLVQNWLYFSTELE